MTTEQSHQLISKLQSNHRGILGRSTMTTDELQDQLDALTEQRDNLLRIIHHMRRIALPYPQWEQWWAQLGGEVVAVERKLAEQEEGDE
jgi:hypothetical protein